MRIYVHFDKEKEIYSAFSGKMSELEGIVFSCDIGSDFSSPEKIAYLESVLKNCNTILKGTSSQKNAINLTKTILISYGLNIKRSS